MICLRLLGELNQLPNGCNEIIHDARCQRSIIALFTDPRWDVAYCYLNAVFGMGKFGFTPGHGGMVFTAVGRFSLVVGHC